MLSGKIYSTPKAGRPERRAGRAPAHAAERLKQLKRYSPRYLLRYPAEEVKRAQVFSPLTGANQQLRGEGIAAKTAPVGKAALQSSGGKDLEANPCGAFHCEMLQTTPALFLHSPKPCPA